MEKLKEYIEKIKSAHSGSYFIFSTKNKKGHVEIWRIIKHCEPPDFHNEIYISSVSSPNQPLTEEIIKQLSKNIITIPNMEEQCIYDFLLRKELLGKPLKKWKP